MGNLDTPRVVRFTSTSRLGDWQKGNLAFVDKVLALPPFNQRTIYVLRLPDGRKVWATDQDVEAHDQLALF